MDRRLFFLLHRAGRVLLAYANTRALDVLGVPSSQLSLLHYVAKHDGCSLTAVADVLDVNKSAVGGIVQRLERGGLIRRAINPLDARGSQLFLTRTGAEVRAEALPLLRKLNAEITEGFTSDEIDTILRFLQATIERFGGDDGDAPDG